MNGKKFDLKTAELVIKNYVGKWKEEMDDSVYNECCKIISNNQIENDTNLKTIRRFLYVWGRMGRVLGRYEFKNWEKRLVLEIRSNCEKLVDFREMELLKTDLEKYEQDIKKCYDAFCSVLGPIGAVKTLHLFCPSFFPLWDNAIAAAFRSERLPTAEKIEQLSSADYYEFMKDVKSFAIKFEAILSALAEKHNKKRLKIIDEFTWLITHRPLSLF